MDNSIVIMGASRCGTSLTAGIFNEHDVWVGECTPGDANNIYGYFENIAMKDYFNYKHCTPENWQKYYPEILANENYDDGKFLFKHGPEFYHLWHGQKPFVVACRRPYHDVVRSRARAGFPTISRKSFNDAQKIMDHAVFLRGTNVYPDEFKNGDFSSVVNALKQCGITPDINTITGFYDCNLWGV